MAPRIHERTRDRISAVQVLYTSELTGKSPSELLDCGLCLVAREAPADEADAAEAGAFGRIEEGTLTDYALALIHGVEAKQAKVDERQNRQSSVLAVSYTHLFFLAHQISHYLLTYLRFFSGLLNPDIKSFPAIIIYGPEVIIKFS